MRLAATHRTFHTLAAAVEYVASGSVFTVQRTERVPEEHVKPFAAPAMLAWELERLSDGDEIVWFRIVVYARGFNGDSLEYFAGVAYPDVGELDVFVAPSYQCDN